MLWFKLLDCLFYLETLHTFRGLHFLDILLACIQIFDYTEGSWKGFFFKLGFTPFTAEQPLRGMEFWEKKHKNIKFLWG